ncbi:MAG: FecR domain-containing protein, partial [Desulfobacterales bacterium]|nr:FecR domain-containing protein [Desulfobacterales bacterium]
MKKHNIIGWILLVLAFPVLCVANQDEFIGKVVAVRGSVVAVAENGQKRALRLNAKVFRRDVIETGTGRVQLMFQDNTLMTLGRNTKMALAAYEWDPENNKAAMETQIREGSFRIMGGAITRMAPEKFKTTSVSGTIGIRGSMYAGNLQGTRLTVLFHGGKGIYVQNRAGRVNIRRPGFATRVAHGDKAPASPTRMSASDLMEFDALLSS